jgi:hypothetical protein
LRFGTLDWNLVCGKTPSPQLAVLAATASAAGPDKTALDDRNEIRIVASMKRPKPTPVAG